MANKRGRKPSSPTGEARKKWSVNEPPSVKARAISNAKALGISVDLYIEGLIMSDQVVVLNTIK